MDDAEVIVINWLNSILGAGWSASGNKPKNTPDKYVLVDRTGGPRVAMVLDAAQILIEVYHKSSRSDAKTKANEIADRVPELKAYAHNVTTAQVNSVVHLPDLITGYERYQVYCDIAVRR
jgi:hypothetical protein